jgi:hypothetical protein
MAGRELDDHVVEPGLGAQQRGGVAVDRRVLVPDLHRHDGAAVLQVDVADLAHVDARHLHGLPLPGRDRLGRGELSLVVGEVRAHHRDPLGQVEALVGEDVAADEDGDDDDADDEREVAGVLGDGAPHRALLVAGWPLPSGGPVAAPLRSGGVLW